MKKALVFVLVISLVAVAGAALARGQGRGGNGGGYGGERGAMMGRGNADCDNCGGERGQMRGRNFGGRGGEQRGAMRGNGFGGRGFGYNQNQNQNQNAPVQFPDEIKAKFAEAQKAGIDLRMELQKRPVDKAKVTELYKKVNGIKQEISDWRFSEYIDTLK